VQITKTTLRRSVPRKCLKSRSSVMCVRDG